LFERATVDFLESGSALIVAVVDADGMPSAGRAWGLTVVSPDEGRVRLLIDAADDEIVEDAAAGGRIAITGAEVATFRSTQLKGRVIRVERASADDDARAARFCEDFFAEVTKLDGTPREMLDRLVPDEYVACEILVDEVFDQTPGPSAGSAVGGSRGAGDG